MTGSKIVEVNNNNNNAKSRSPTGDKFTSRMTRRKQSATWKDRFITIQLFSKQTLQINIQVLLCSQIILALVNHLHYFFLFCLSLTSQFFVAWSFEVVWNYTVHCKIICCFSQKRGIQKFLNRSVHS